MVDFSALAVRQLCTALRHCSPERVLDLILDLICSGRLCQQRSTKWLVCKASGGTRLAHYF